MYIDYVVINHVHADGKKLKIDEEVGRSLIERNQVKVYKNTAKNLAVHG